MTGIPVLISGLSAIADGYDALICDVWGVLHDGVRAHPAAVEALMRFRAGGGRVVLLSNAPRPATEIVTQLRLFGIPDDAYNTVVTSGGSARVDLQGRIAGGVLKLVHIGPTRDETLFKDLAIEEVRPEVADIALCTGLYDDTTETPDDYAAMLAVLKAHDLPMICANPDVMVPRAGQLVHCAGGIALAYEKIGGTVIYYGKPHKPIYGAAIEAVGKGARILVVGDALETDVAGANAMGLDVLFVAHGLHKDEIGEVTPASLAALFTRHGLAARAAVEVFKW